MPNIQSLPPEILIYILETGCVRGSRETARKPPHRPHPRQLKPFARLASAICREWRGIVQALRFWFCCVTFHGRSTLDNPAAPNPKDIVAQIVRLKHQLQQSQDCDIDVYFAIWYGDVRYTAGALDAIERLSIHAFLLLVPFAHQIRSLEINTRSLEQILIAINALGRLPRLEYFKLRGGDTFNNEPECVVVDPLLSPGYPADIARLDMSALVNCDILKLKYYNILGRIKSHEYVTVLKLRDTRTEGSHWARWEDIRALLSQVINLEKLYLQMPETYVWRSAGPIPSNTPLKLVTLPCLKEVVLGTSLEIMCTLFSEFSTPYIHRLDFRLPLNDVPDSKLPAILQVSLKDILHFRYLTSFQLKAGHHWSELHDECVDALLPTALDVVIVDFSMRTYRTPLRRRTPRAAGKMSIAIPSIYYLAYALSQWSPEDLSILLGGPLEQAPKDEVILPDLKTLKVQNGAVFGLYGLLSIIVAPQLRSVDIASLNGEDDTLKPHPYSPRVKHALGLIEHMTFKGGTFPSPLPTFLAELITIGKCANLINLTISLSLQMENFMDLIVLLEDLVRTGACPNMASIQGKILCVFATRHQDRYDDFEKSFREAVGVLQASRDGRLVVELEIKPKSAGCYL